MLGLGMRMKNSVSKFCDWEWEWKTVLTTQFVKELNKEYREKVGNGNFRSCLILSYKACACMLCTSLIWLSFQTFYCISCTEKHNPLLPIWCFDVMFFLVCFQKELYNITQNSNTYTLCNMLTNAHIGTFTSEYIRI